jgi:uncharacterized protein (TIGR02265 family)
MSADSIEPVVFDSVIATLVRLAEPLEPSVRAKLEAAGLPLKGKLQPAYPASSWALWLRMLSEILHPGIEAVEAQRRIGKASVAYFMEGPLAKALFATLRLLGPKRALMRLTRNMRTANNYTEARVTELGPGRYEVWFNEVDGVPGFYIGLLETALGALGARQLRVEVKSVEGSACTYHVSWAA